MQELVRQQHPEAAARKPRKYRNEFVVDHDGVIYESALERDTKAELELLLARRKIASWSWGPRFVLQNDPEQPNTLIYYRPDFLVRPSPEGFRVSGVLITCPFIVDAKGRRTAVFNNKVRQWKVRYPKVPLVLVAREERWKLA